MTPNKTLDKNRTVEKVANQIRVHDLTQEERLNKYLASIGIASRREVDKLIANHMLAVNGRSATLGTKVKNGDTITLLFRKESFAYYLYYKPAGETTGVLKSHPTLHPVGRLDKESEGLLLYTNDYRVTEALLQPAHKNERTYLVKVREATTPRVATILLRGIRTQEGTYSPAKKVDLLPNKHDIRIVLTEGKKHEIRRMLNALNLTILQLIREKILFLTIRGLNQGSTRALTDEELKRFLAAIKLDDSNS